MMEDAGHWLQQERPAEVNAALLGSCAAFRQLDRRVALRPGSMTATPAARLAANLLQE